LKPDPFSLPHVASPLPHSLFDPEDGVELCLFVTDDSVEKIKAKLIELRVGGFTKVMGVTKLRTKYREFVARRALVARYAAFFADKRVVPMMPKLCGKPFFSRRKQPMPVEVAHGDLAAALSEVRDSTYLTLGAQTVSLKIGRAHMPARKVAANIVAAIEPAVARLPGKWKGVKSIYLRGVDTVSAPLYRASDADIEAAEAALVRQSGADKATQGGAAPAKTVADDFFGGEEEQEEVTKAAPQKKTKGAKDSATASADTAKNIAAPKAAPAPVKASAPGKQQLAPAAAAAVGGKRPRPASEPSEALSAVATKKPQVVAASSAAAKPAPGAVSAPAVVPAAALSLTAVKSASKTSAPSAKTAAKPAGKKAK
jgi:ribosome biogenesis protein UTP30